MQGVHTHPHRTTFTSDTNRPFRGFPQPPSESTVCSKDLQNSRCSSIHGCGLLWRERIQTEIKQRRDASDGVWEASRPAPSFLPMEICCAHSLYVGIFFSVLSHLSRNSLSPLLLIQMWSMKAFSQYFLATFSQQALHTGKPIDFNSITPHHCDVIVADSGPQSHAHAWSQ